MYFFNVMDYELCLAKIRLFAVVCTLLCVPATTVWCNLFTEFVVLVPKCQNVIADYVKLSFLFECQIVLLKVKFFFY